MVVYVPWAQATLVGAAAATWHNHMPFATPWSGAMAVPQNNSPRCRDGHPHLAPRRGTMKTYKQLQRVASVLLDTPWAHFGPRCLSSSCNRDRLPSTAAISSRRLFIALPPGTRSLGSNVAKKSPSFGPLLSNPCLRAWRARAGCARAHIKGVTFSTDDSLSPRFARVLKCARAS